MDHLSTNPGFVLYKDYLTTVPVNRAFSMYTIRHDLVCLYLNVLNISFLLNYTIYTFTLEVCKVSRFRRVFFYILR